jgi:hypothetical protein
MKILKTLVVSAFAGLLMIGSAHANQITGSMVIAALSTTLGDGGTSVGNTSLLNSTIVVSGSTLGDYSIVPTATSYSNFTLDLTNFSTFTFSNATYGTFTGTSGEIVSRSDNGNCPGSNCGGFLDVFILGTYSGLGGLDPTPTSFRISFTETGGSISASGTLASPATPPPGVPEPATLTLFGSALVGLGLIGRKRLQR